MDIDLAALPDDVGTLQKLVRSLAVERTSLHEAQAEIERLHLIIKKLQRSQFGRRAERLDNDQLQLGLEDLNTDLARIEASLPLPRRPKTSGGACRRTSPARTSGSMSRIRPALAVAARCIWSVRRLARCSTTSRRGCGSSASAGRAMAAAPAGPSIRLLLRSGRSPRASRRQPCSPMSWSPNTAIIFLFTWQSQIFA